MSTKNQQVNYTNNKTVQSRYMQTDKKRYLLTSANEDEQALITKQKDELTSILIDLKSEYDKLSRESKCKLEDIKELEKKSKILEQMDSKKKKKFKEINDTNEVMKQAIEMKKTKKSEELYKKKTLEKQIENLKTDILVLQKDILKEENQTKRYEKQYNKLRIQENDIKEKKNHIFSQIIRQNKKNELDAKDSKLQIEYYENYINQKSKFLKAEDERKEKQAAIARAAKNDSMDKTEVEIRKAFELTKLYNQYLREKMNRQLDHYDDLENVFRKVREISVSSYFINLIGNLKFKENFRSDFEQRQKI